MKKKLKNKVSVKCRFIETENRPMFAWGQGRNGN